jgi:Ion channel
MRLGFGDITPLTTLARILVTIEAILGVILIGLFLSALGLSIARQASIPPEEPSTVVSPAQLGKQQSWRITTIIVDEPYEHSGRRRKQRRLQALVELLPRR